MLLVAVPGQSGLFLKRKLSRFVVDVSEAMPIRTGEPGIEVLEEEVNMKKIEAIICPAKAGDTYDVLEAVGCLDIMFSEIGDRMKQKSIEEDVRKKMYYRAASLNKAKLAIVVNDSDVEKIVKAICTVAATGKAGDGRVLVYDITDTRRISTGVWEKTTR